MAIFKKSVFKKVLKASFRPFKKIKLIIKQQLGWLGVPKIVLYRSFIMRNELIVNGIITEDKGLEKPNPKASVWQNIVAMLKRYSSDEIPGLKVWIKVGKHRSVVESDEDGKFSLRENLTDAELRQLKGHWIPVEAGFEEKITEDDFETQAKSEVYKLDQNAEYGIISDIDDTILVSHATQTLKKLRLMLLRNAHSRRPFPGVVAFYKALQYGMRPNSYNPLFYVSSSEWNLYDLLEDFRQLNDIPRGIFLLKDIEHKIYQFWKSGGGSHSHKLDKIDLILNGYPDLQFVLLGDSGQKDPYIYLEAIKRWPGRIKAVYLRHIKKNGMNERRLNSIMEEYKQLHVPVYLSKTSYEAAQDAVKRKLILPASLNYIGRNRKEDQQKPTLAESIWKTVKEPKQQQNEFEKANP